MNVAERRQQLMIYIAELPDAKVDELYAELKRDFAGPTLKLTENQIGILEKRHAEHISGKSIPSPWKEVHERIRNKRKSA